jgi:hypothetical protein
MVTVSDSDMTDVTDDGGNKMNHLVPTRLLISGFAQLSTCQVAVKR